MRFRDWFMQLEVFDANSIQQHQPKDGRWEPPLDKPSGSYSFYFNVPGDNCGTPAEPCYTVYIENTEYGASVSFARNDSIEDSNKGVANEVFMSVLKALSEFIDAKHPVELGWISVTKTKINPITGELTNPNAREHIYEKWALRNLFPDRYVPIDSSNWVRRDIYDSNYVRSLGYPPVPKGVTGSSSLSQKKIAYNKMTVEDKIGVYIRNTETNPYNLKIGDIVDLSFSRKYLHKKNVIGKILDFRLDGNSVVAEIAVYYNGKSTVGNYDYVKLRELRPRTEEIVTSSFKIGDIVSIVAGLNKNKTGKIAQFQSGTKGNRRAIVVDNQNNQFTANIQDLRRAS